MDDFETDWGVPDWTSPQNYQMPPADDAFMRAIPWEFLRRNHDYRKWWKETVEPLIEEDGALPDNTAHIYSDLENRWGLIGFPPSPKDGHGAFFVALRRISGSSLGRQHYHDLCRRFEKSEIADFFADQVLMLKRSEIAYLFDMTLPLDGQFAQALIDAKQVQEMRSKRGEFNFKDARRRPEKYITYLRILDADDAGAKTAKIAETLYPDHLEPVDRLKKDRKSAHKLRDGGYRELASLSTRVSG